MAVPVIAWVLGVVALGAAGVAAAVGRESTPDPDPDPPLDYDAFEAFVQVHPGEPVRTGSPGDPVRTGGGDSATPPNPNGPQVRKKKGKAQAAKVQPTAIPAEWTTRSSTIELTRKWHCDKPEDLDIPQIPIPPQVLAFGGPIAQGAVAAIDAFFAGLKKMGGPMVCTTGLGEFVVLDVRPYQAARVKLTLSWSKGTVGGPLYPPVRIVTFSGERGSSGEIPAVEVDDTPWGIGKPVNPVSKKEADYLRTGWPAGDLAAKWLEPPGPLQPKVELLRDGSDLTLVLWLPPRGGDTRWIAEWTMRPA